MNNYTHQFREPSPRFWRSRYGIAFLVIATIAGYFLIKEHTAHVAGILPFLLLAACPLMHVFMHRGHDHRGHDHSENTQNKDASNTGARDHREDHL
jgi:hypothetical protein